MQRVCNIGVNFLPKSRIDKLYWFKIHRVVTNFKPKTFIGKAPIFAKRQFLQDGGSYNDMLQRCGVFIEFLMFQGIGQPPGLLKFQCQF